MQPINYLGMIPQPDIGQSLLQGLKIGAGIQDLQAATELKQQQLQERQQAQALQEQYARDLQAALQSPTAQGFATLTAKYPKQREAFESSWKTLSEAQQSAEFGAGTEAFNAIQSGRPDVAKSKLEERIEAMQNAGRDPSRLIQMRDALDRDPKLVAGQIGLVLSSIDPDRWSKTTKTQLEAELQPLVVAEKQAGIAEKRAGVANLQSQITERAARLNLDRDKLQTDVEMKLTELQAKHGELGEGAKKLVNDSVIASTAGEALASNMTTLADQFEREGGGYGGMSKFAEWAKRAGGLQGGMTELRNNYARLRNSAAMKNLPPGPATDKDIEMARQGMPPETADAAHISSFLRGMAKIERMSAQLEDAKAQWIGSVGTLGKPRSDIEIGGVKVPAGTTFNEFQRQFAQRRASGIEAQQAQAPGGAIQSLFDRYSKPTGQ